VEAEHGRLTIDQDQDREAVAEHVARDLLTAFSEGKFCQDAQPGAAVRDLAIAARDQLFLVFFALSQKGFRGWAARGGESRSGHATANWGARWERAWQHSRFRVEWPRC
jgi:hypothetical protein